MSGGPDYLIDIELYTEKDGVSMGGSSAAPFTLEALRAAEWMFCTECTFSLRDGEVVVMLGLI